MGERRVYKFRRYVGGQERAEGIEITRAETLEQAMLAAVRLCPRDRQPTVLVLEDSSHGG